MMCSFINLFPFYFLLPFAVVKHERYWHRNPQQLFCVGSPTAALHVVVSIVRSPVRSVSYPRYRSRRTVRKQLFTPANSTSQLPLSSVPAFWFIMTQVAYNLMFSGHVSFIWPKILVSRLGCWIGFLVMMYWKWIHPIQHSRSNRRPHFDDESTTTRLPLMREIAHPNNSFKNCIRQTWRSNYMYTTKLISNKL